MVRTLVVNEVMQQARFACACLADDDELEQEVCGRSEQAGNAGDVSTGPLPGRVRKRGESLPYAADISSDAWSSMA